jgi:hypothetical protein
MGKMKKRGTFLGMDAHRTDRPLIQKRPPSKFPVLWLWALGLWSVLSSGSLAQDFSATESQASVLDATLHDCLMLSIDRAFAVGDAGAILLTEDGGKQWKSLQPLRSEMNYYAIGMDDPVSLGVAQGALPQRSGLIVGGTLQPATGRSIGTVLTTQDDGKTWTPSVIPGLPRLIGLQRIKHRHWIAWGDWSDHFASSLFESIDGGKSWSPRKIPCGHLQGVAVSSWSIEQAVSSLRPMVLILNPLTSIPMLFDLYVFASCSRKAGGSAVTVPNYGTRRTRSIGRRSSSRSILKMLRWSIACRWSASWIDCGWSASQGMSSGVQTIKDGVGKDFQRQRPPSFSMLMHWMIKSSWLADAWGISCNRETQGDPGENPMRLLSGIWA